MLKILNHLKTRLRTTKDVAKLALTGLLFCIPFTASHACSVHDHGCIYHGFNATVNTSYPTTNTDTSVVLYSIGKTPNTGTPSNVDFDNKVWIPELTGDKVNGSYTTPTGAYILNNTAYGTTHPPADTYAPDDRYRLVYPSQYQITFNQNSAVAKHTGDFNGAENGNIPNATGCPNMPNAANCEAVVVTGNVPTGFYDQQVRIFNSTGNPNPAVDLQVGVYTTGKARLVTPSHIDNRNETADFQSISGTGATTPLYRYEIVNTGYEPHAGGTAYFDQNRTYTTGYGKPYTSGSHIYQNRFDTTDTTRTKIYKYGAGEQSLQARNFSTKHLYLGEVAPPPPPPALTKVMLPAWALMALSDTKQALKDPRNMALGITAITNPREFVRQVAANQVGSRLNGYLNSLPKQSETNQLVKTNRYLDGLQTGLDVTSLVGITGVGEVVSTPADIGNTVLSFGRATFNSYNSFGYRFSGWLYDSPVDRQIAEEKRKLALSQYGDASLSFAGMIPFVNGGVLKQGVKKADEIYSTGDAVARNLREMLAMKEVLANPHVGTVITDNITNWRLVGWDKVTQNIKSLDGVNVEIHYLLNKVTGEFADFKFKRIRK